MRNTAAPSWRSTVAFTITTIVTLGACGSSEPAAQGALAPSVPAATVATETARTAAPAPTTTAPTTAPATTEPCGQSCSLTDDQQAAVDSFFEAYNGDDWNALLATLAADEPAWNFTSSVEQSTDLMRYDFIWASALDQVTTVDKCFGQYEAIVCLVDVEDDVHRLLAPYGMEPSACKMAFEFRDGLVDTRSFNAFDCFRLYDGVMHTYGEWFASTYPDLDPISGAHYRAWNQTDETAGARAAEYLDEWGVGVREFFENGGKVMGLEL